MSYWPTFALYVDTDGQGLGAAGDNIIADVLAIETWLGFDDPRDRTAPPCRMRVKVNNALLAYNPEVTARVEIGRFVRLAGDGNDMWTGTIQGYEAAEEDTEAWIICAGRWRGAGAVIDLPAYASVNAGLFVLDVLQMGLMQQQIGSAGAGIWMVDVVGHAELGTNTFLGEQVSDVSIGGGDTTLIYPARDLVRPTVREAIEAATRAEWGRFYEDKSGNFVWQSRSAVVSVTTGTPVGGGDLVIDSYVLGGDIVNQVVLNLSSYVITEDYAVWTSIAPIVFRPGYTEYKVRFLRSDGRPYSVVGEALRPSNFVFKTGSVSGTTVTPAWGVVMTANGAVLKVDNRRSSKIYLQIGAVLTTDVLTEDTPAEQVMRDYESISRYGVHSLPFAMPAFADTDLAVDVADHILGAFKTPEGRLRSVTFRNDTAALAALQISLAPYYALAVSLDNLNHEGTYYTARVHHTITPDAFVTECLLEPFFKFWHVEVAGFGELDETTILSY